MYNIHTCIAFPMSHNNNTFTVHLEYEEDCYLFYFDNKRNYSIAQRKLITCEVGNWYKKMVPNSSLAIF